MVVKRQVECNICDGYGYYLEPVYVNFEREYLAKRLCDKCDGKGFIWVES